MIISQQHGRVLRGAAVEDGERVCHGKLYKAYLKAPILSKVTGAPCEHFAVFIEHHDCGVAVKTQTARGHWQMSACGTRTERQRQDRWCIGSGQISSTQTGDRISLPPYAARRGRGITSDYTAGGFSKSWIRIGRARSRARFSSHQRNLDRQSVTEVIGP